MTDFAARRRMMVDTQVRTSDVNRFPIIDAMLNVPREDFVPATQRETAYIGAHLPFARGRVTLDPRTFSKMVDAADIGPSHLVLDVGCGYGYSAAIIARLAQACVALEEDETAAAEAQAALTEHGVDTAIVETGALVEGAAEHGPYDIIVIEGGVEMLPGALLAQLKDEGRIVAVFMEGDLGTARVGHKLDGHITWRYAFNAAAPVLPGFAKAPAFAL